MTEIASPCCGSCEWFCWNGSLLKYNCHNPEIVKQHKHNSMGTEGLCLPSYYSPRNPIPLIKLSGVKELVEKAYRDGYVEAFGVETSGYLDSYLTNSVYEYMKALEAKKCVNPVEQ